MSKNWFDHDYGARNDEKILELRARHGSAGYGLYFMLIECLAENHGYFPHKRLGGLSIGLGVPINQLDSFVKECIELGLLHINESGDLYSNRLLKHVNKMKVLSEAGKRGVETREKNRKMKQSEGVYKEPIKPPLSHPSTDKNRLEEIREENTRSRKRSVSSDEVESIYGLYPYKKARGAALVAIEKAIRELTSKPHLIEAYLQTQADKLAHLPPERLLELKKPVTFLSARVAKFAKAWEGVEDKRFCPHPATWFNEQRYFDEAPYKVAQSTEKEPELFEKRYV